MKNARVCTVMLWLNLIFLIIVQLGGLRIQAPGQFKKLIHGENFKAGVPDVIAATGGITSLVKMDYNRPPSAVIKDVGNTVLPMITAGLGMIPGGAMIGGVMYGIWGLISPLFGGPPGKSPIEMAIDDIKEEMDNLKEQVSRITDQISELQKIPEEMRKEMKERLASIVSRAVHAEVSRNSYVCNKYAIISKDFTDDLKAHKPVNESLRIEMIALLNDCDNFLKDTSESFVYDEFADVLWLPAVMTTMVRVSFLTEISNYGMALKIEKDLLMSFWMELEKDLKRIFKYSDKVANMRVESFVGLQGRHETYDHSDYNMKLHNALSFTSNELEACKMQAQLLYFHRTIYPYGPPKHHQISDENDELKISEYNVTSNEYLHIQVTYKKQHTQNNYNDDLILNFLNCISGPSVFGQALVSKLSFRVTYVPNKKYQLRILYFLASAYKDATGDVVKAAETDGGDLDRFVAAKEEGENTLKISLIVGEFNSDNPQRFVFETGFHVVDCDFWDPPSKKEDCVAAARTVSGRYIVEDVASYSVSAGEKLNGKIVVESLRGGPVSAAFNVDIIGIEFIVRPMSDK